MQNSTANITKARGMYLCYYLALGSFLLYINLHYVRIGLTGVEIGSLAAIPVVVLSSTSLLWGTLSDAFRLHSRILSLAFLFSLFQPAREHFSKSSLRFPLRRFLRLDLLIFLTSVFLLATTTSAVNAFFSIYMDGIGAREGSIGLGWALAAVTEIPVMIFSGKIMQRIGAGGLLKVAFLVYALRWLLLSFIQHPVLALMMQLLHGISLAPFLIGGVIYIHSRVPEDLSTTAQAAFNTVIFGMGSISGALLGGFLYDLVGMAVLFRVLCVVALAGLALFWLGNLPRSNIPLINS